MSRDKGNTPANVPAEKAPTRETPARAHAFGDDSPEKVSAKMVQETQEATNSLGIGDLALAPQQQNQTAQYYGEQQNQRNQNMNIEVIKAVGINAPDRIKALYKQILVDRRPNPRERALGQHLEISDEDRAEALAYQRLKQKDYYPHDFSVSYPPGAQKNLPPAWEEARLAHIGRELTRAVLLHPKHEDEARDIVMKIAPQITWGEKFDPAGDPTVFWESVNHALTTINTAIDPIANTLFNDRPYQTTTDRAGNIVNLPPTRPFQGLWSRLRADAAAVRPTRLHAERDNFLSGLKNSINPKAVLASPFDSQVSKMAEADTLARKREKFVGGANPISEMARSVDVAVQALDNGDMNAARAEIDKAKADNPRYTEWLGSAFDQGRASLRKKFDRLHELLDQPNGQRSDAALQSLVTPDLLRILDKQQKTPTELTFSGVVVSYIKMHHNLASRNETLSQHKRNINGMIKAAMRTQPGIIEAEIKQYMNEIR